MAASRRILQKPFITWLILLLGAACSLVPLRLIATEGVNIPIWDDWTAYGTLLVHLHTHQVTAHDFFVQAAEHRIFLPRVIFALLTLRDWNAIRVMYAELAVVCLTSLGILRLIVVTQGIPIGAHRRITVGIAVQWLMCNLFIFCPQQFENWIWGTGLANVMPMLFTTAALLILTSAFHPWTKVILAVICCGAAEYSSGNGFLSWVLAGILLAWSDSWQEFRAKFRQLFFFCICAGLLGGTYFINFDWNCAAPEGFAKTLWQEISYIIIFLGNIGPWESARWIIGGTLLAVYAMCSIAFIIFRLKGVDHQIIRQMLVWLLVGAFAIGSAVMAAPRRAGYGIWQAAASRYTTFSIYLVVSVIVLVPMIWNYWLQRPRKTTGIPEIKTPRNAPRAARAIAAWLVPGIVYCGLIWALSLGFNGAFLVADSTIAARARAGKCGLILYQALPDNFAVQLLTNLPDHGYSMAVELNHLGLLHLPMVTSNIVDEFRDNDSNSRGAIVGSTLQEGKIVLNVWSFNLKTSRPASAILISYENANHRNIALTLADIIEGTYKINSENGGAAYSIHGWKVAIPLGLFPVDLKQTVITAWAMDGETGKATPLNDPVTLNFDSGKI